MPDISMCTGENCPLAEQCYRKRAKPSKWLQSYFSKPPVNSDGTCRYHMPLYEDEKCRQSTSL